jgi:hypothetical protein
MLHLFRDGQSDVFALTRDRSGRNLPAAQDSDWSFLETLDPVRLAWGEEHFGEVDRAIAAAGFFLFEAELLPSTQPAHTGAKGRASESC